MLWWNASDVLSPWSFRWSQRDSASVAHSGKQLTDTPLLAFLPSLSHSPHSLTSASWGYFSETLPALTLFSQILLLEGTQLRQHLSLVFNGALLMQFSEE